MTKNPYINALCAAVYIAVVATIMQNGKALFGTEDGFLVPVAMLSLLVLSAALMAYIFFYHPVRSYLDGQKKEATDLFFKTLGTFAVITILVFISLFLLRSSHNPAAAATDYKNAEYVIEGTHVKLVDGAAETESAPDSAIKVTTRYFGNEVRSDLDGDGSEDVTFLLTQQSGGSGTFYYVVAALHTDHGYVGSEGFLLGDRIAPQTTEKGQGKVIVVNYADRAPGEPFTTQPSVAKSLRLVFEPVSMKFTKAL
ncbi:MAG: hypothetical protein V4481_00650 [Patescibacteria group bacterium]